MKKKGHLFISYAREDLTFVDMFDKDLRKAGFDIWRDLASIDPGQEWFVALQEALKDCIAFVPILSRHYFQSEFCKKELFYAQVEKIPISPIWYEPENHVNRWQRYQIPEDVKKYQAIHVFSGTPVKKREGDEYIEVINPIYDNETYWQALQQMIDIGTRPPNPGPLTDDKNVLAQLTTSVAFQWLVYVGMGVVPGLAGLWFLCFYCAGPILLVLLVHAGKNWIAGRNTNNAELQRWSIIAGGSTVIGPIASILLNVIVSAVF